MATDTTTLIRRARSEGWTAKISGKGRHQTTLTSPTGAVVRVGNNRSDWRAVRNGAAELRRAGLGDNPDTARGERVARHDGLTNNERVLAALQSAGRAVTAPDIALVTGMTVPQISSGFHWLKSHHPEIHSPERGMYEWIPKGGKVTTDGLVAAALVPSSTMASRKAEAEANLDPRGDFKWCSCGKRFRTVGHHKDHIGQLVDPRYHVLTDEPPSKLAMEQALRNAPMVTTNGNGNGKHHDNPIAVSPTAERVRDNVAAVDALSSLQEVAEATVEIATVADSDRQVLKVVPSARPTDLPAMFEAVTTDGQGHLILRDEHGNIWMAAPMKPVL